MSKIWAAIQSLFVYVIDHPQQSAIWAASGVIVLMLAMVTGHLVHTWRKPDEP